MWVHQVNWWLYRQISGTSIGCLGDIIFKSEIKLLYHNLVLFPGCMRYYWCYLTKRPSSSFFPKMCHNKGASANFRKISAVRVLRYARNGEKLAPYIRKLTHDASYPFHWKKFVTMLRLCKKSESELVVLKTSTFCREECDLDEIKFSDSISQKFDCQFRWHRCDVSLLRICYLSLLNQRA